jgi:hypothetical protein
VSDETTTAPAPEKVHRENVRIDLTDQWAGYYAVVRTGVSARIALKLDTAEDDLGAAIEAFSSLVVEHNFPALTGGPATDLLDVDVRIIAKVMSAWREQIAELPSA